MRLMKPLFIGPQAIFIFIINLCFPFDESFKQHKLANYSRKAIAKFCQTIL
jgi:hypothetical protein